MQRHKVSADMILVLCSGLGMAMTCVLATRPSTYNTDIPVIVAFATSTKHDI